MNCVFLSHKAGAELRSFLMELGKNLIDIKETGCVYSEIADHPDIYVCLIDESLIASPEQYETLPPRLRMCLTSQG